MSNKNQKNNNNIIDRLELPKDILLGLPILTFQGNMELTIENHKGLLQYEGELIKIRTKSFVVSIMGKNLVILEYREDILTIKGQIEGMQFLL